MAIGRARVKRCAETQETPTNNVAASKEIPRLQRAIRFMVRRSSVPEIRMVFFDLTLEDFFMRCLFALTLGFCAVLPLAAQDKILRGYTIPLLDLADQKQRQVIV